MKLVFKKDTLNVSIDALNEFILFREMINLCDKLLTINAILPKINGDAAFIRSMWSFNHVAITFNDDDDWDFDPISDLDQLNFALDYLTFDTVDAMMKKLDSFRQRKHFIFSFGARHRFFNRLQRSFNEKLSNTELISYSCNEMINNTQC